MNKRIEYIDLAKGICILLIALTHTYGDSGGRVMEVLSFFKIPVFFMLSGFFFRKYDSCTTFIKKKTNQLLIPIFFSFIFFSLLSTLFFYIKSGDNLIIRDIFFLPDTWKINFGLSPSTWFLVCLLLIDILCYCIYRVFEENFTFLIILAFLGGGVGYYLNFRDISIPIWFDTALTTIPYFIIGNLIWTKTGFMLEKNSFKHYLFFLVTFIVVLFMIYTMGENDNIFYAANRYTDVGIVRLYMSGFAGSFFIVLLSKFIVKIPIVSYIGRYSIVVLITHQFYLFVIRNILYQINAPQDSIWVSLGVFILVVLISLPTIKYGIKYFPYCFAQKELLK